MVEPLVDITSHDAYVDGVPRSTFRYLRERDPVHWTEEPDGGRGFWSITTYDDVLFASRNTDVFSSRLGIRLEDMDAEETEARRTMMEMDAPEHTRLRRLVSRPFAPKTVNEYEDVVRDLAAEVLDSLDGEREFNFVQRIARELPMRMLGRLLGLPDDDLDWLVLRGDALIGNSDPDLHRLRGRPDRHLGVPVVALSLPRRLRALRVRDSSPRGASPRPDPRHLERAARADRRR